MTLKKNVQLILIFLALVSFAVAWQIAYEAEFSTDEILKALGILVAFNYFMYKMLAGWLFINVDLDIENERRVNSGNPDDLVLKIKLKKGGIDSLWLEKIEIRLSEVIVVNGENTYSNRRIVEPIGYTKFHPEKGNYWKEQNKFSHYVISTKEQTSFAAYTQVKTNAIIAVEVLVLGTRPFYGIETRNKLIQWKSSAFILPAE